MLNNNNNCDNFWKNRILEHLETVNELMMDDDFYKQIQKLSRKIAELIKNGGRILICGNGGSAADSQHIATELVGKFFLERRPINAEALTVNTSSLTAIGNDYSFDKVFSRQVEAKSGKGDCLIAISTSGNSKNVVEAIKSANKIGVLTIGLTGNNTKCLIGKLVDYCLFAPSDSTPRIQEIHVLMYHLFCEFIERELFGVSKKTLK